MMFPRFLKMGKKDFAFDLALFIMERDPLLGSSSSLFLEDE